MIFIRVLKGKKNLLFYYMLCILQRNMVISKNFKNDSFSHDSHDKNPIKVVMVNQVSTMEEGVLDFNAYNFLQH